MRSHWSILVAVVAFAAIVGWFVTRLYGSSPVDADELDRDLGALVRELSADTKLDAAMFTPEFRIGNVPNPLHLRRWDLFFQAAGPRVVRKRR